MARDVRTICPYCGVGCGLLASVEGDRLLQLRGDPGHPANLGKLCLKGALAGQTLDVPSRLRLALVRGADGVLAAVSSAQAVAVAAARLARIRDEHGGGAIGFYLSGQLTTESQYLAGKLARGYLRTNHVDSNSRLCMASAATAMKRSLGADGPPVSYADIERADTFLFLGSNAADCHPVTFDRVMRQVKRTGGCALVVDPRRTRTAAAATLHLALRPGTDLALLHAWLKILREEGRLDRDYIARATEGWEALEALLEGISLEETARTCGIEERLLRRSAAMIGDARGLISFWAMGVNQSLRGTVTSCAIINLHLATGHIQRPGSGPFSLTGQPNAMGGRDAGYLSHLLPGSRTLASAAHRREIEALWGLPEGTILAAPGHDTRAMFEALERGELKALWILGTNPAASLPDLSRVRSALRAAELVIVQDAYFPTETTAHAHVVLPAAVNLEQHGTFTNSERRVSLLEPVAPPPGDARPDWWWLREIGLALGAEALRELSSAAAIYDDFARTTAGQANDQSGLSHARLHAEGPLAWPCAAGADPVPLHGDRRFATPTGKARFWATPHEVLAEEESPDGDYPLLLTTGRVANQWHTRTKTGTVARLNRLAPEPYLEMHPDDVAALGLEAGQPVSIRSRRGLAHSVVRPSEDTPAGLCFMPMHWNELWAEGASVNEVTSPEGDPVSKQPALKCCAVRVEARPRRG